MKLLKVLLKGFRTFRQQQWVELPTAPGLYLVRGINEVDPFLEGNDVGKSTLWDAVYWCFYGTTTRGLRAGNIIAWGEEQAYVGVELEIGGLIRCIFRQQNPNELRIDGNITTQDQVENLIGRNAIEFLHSVLIGQFTDYFMDLGPSDKLDLFSGVLGLDYWEERAELAKNKSAVVASEVDKLARQLEKEEGRLEALRESYEALDTDSKIWAFESRQKKKDLYARICVLKKKYRENQGNCFEVKKKLVQLRVPEQDCQKGLIEERALLVQTQDRLREIAESLQLRICPFCKTSLGKEWRERLEGEQARLENVLVCCKARIARETKIHNRLQLQIEHLQNRHSIYKDNITRLNYKLGAREKELLAENQNPFRTSLTTTYNNLKAVKTKQRFLRAKHAHTSIVHSRLSYWVKGFRDLRLWILDSTLTELEIQCNNSLIQLGLERWVIHMSVERETKFGGIARGFQVQIESPGSAQCTPWKGWGGGVTQRLRLAVQMGLASLISSRKQSTLQVEVWDEPTAHLSNRGVEDLLVHLQARSLAEQKAVFIVDHRALHFAFDGVITVTKTFDSSILSNL